MKQYCDLHTHSNYSDGTLTPAQLLTAAEQAGLSAVALTDHNTVAGLPAFLEAAAAAPVEGVPGVEFSTDYGAVELHILGLFIRPEHYGPITAMTEQMMLRKQQSNRQLIDDLNRAGYEVSYEKIKAAMPAGEPNRAHIAAELTRLGYTASNKEAFQTLLSAKRGYYQPPKRIDVFEVISYLRSAGAVPVLAHPFLNLKEREALERFLGPAREAGLAGMETLYPLFTPEQTAAAEELAEKYGLLPSGGSDFHGENKPDIRLGTGKGTLRVPLAFLEGLKSAVCCDGGTEI